MVIYKSVVFLCLFYSVSLFAESNLVDIPTDELLDGYLESEEAPPYKANHAPAISKETQNTRRYESADPTVVEVEANYNNSIEPSDGIEVILLEEHDETVSTVNAGKTPVSSSKSTAKSTPHQFCMKNPRAKECLYSHLLKRCKKDPQSQGCASQLEKFEGFCEVFPRAYKCKKAKIAEACLDDPQIKGCKTFSQQYCERFPDIIFCDVN